MDNINETFINRAFGNENFIKKSKRCGCYSCCKIFNSEEIKYFSREKNGNRTAWCPHCGIDAVVDEKFFKQQGHELTEDFLREINKFAF